MEEIFHIGDCPICREYGRLEINKDVTNNEYVIRCEECFAEYKNPQDALKNINGRRCFGNREIRSATFNEIKSLGWDKFVVEKNQKDLVGEFVKNIYEGLVEENKNIYKDFYENKEITKMISDHGKNTLELYQSLAKKQKDVFMDTVEQIMIDTIACVFAVFDSSGFDFECEVKIDGVSTENNLSGTFLSYVEEIRSK